MTQGSPPPGAHPRVLLASAAETFGEPEVVAWCTRLVTGQEHPDDPDLRWVGGTEDWLPYWRRTWGARGLLYVWSAEAVDAVEHALHDEHWRVREMALKVVRARVLEALTGPVAGLREDPYARVRGAAERALIAITAGSGHPVQDDIAAAVGDAVRDDASRLRCRE